jgi:hypothetical protein
MIQRIRQCKLKELSTGDWSRLMLKRRKRYMRLDILRPVLMFHVFWDVNLCHCVSEPLSPEGLHDHHLQGQAV